MSEIEFYKWVILVMGLAFVGFMWVIRSVNREDKLLKLPYTCHVVSRETYTDLQIGDELEGKEIVEGFVNSLHHVLVTTEPRHDS